MMQRWCSNLRRISFSNLQSTLLPVSYPSPQQLHLAKGFSSPNVRFFHCISSISSFSPPFNVPSTHPAIPHAYSQVRHISAKKKRRNKASQRRPITPAVSRVKKIKMKSYSSFKGRFRTLNNGTIRRWKAGRRHNAHTKTNRAKRRLRVPGIVHAAYAKVMKKLDFCG